MADYRLLRDSEEKKFQTIVEVEEFFTQQKMEDNWQSPCIANVSVHMLEDCPILMADVKEKHGIEYLLDETVQDTMEGTRLMLHVNDNGCVTEYPVRDTAITSICERAGLKGSAITASYRDRAVKETFCNILNEAFTLWNNKDSQVLIRDEKVSAVHSQEYCVFPTIDLLTVLKRSLDKDFPGYQLKSAETSHSLTVIMYDLSAHADTLLGSINKALKRNGKEEIKGTPQLLFTTSDTAGSGANLYPYILTKDVKIRIGTPIRLRHSGNNEIADFMESCNKIFSIFQDATEKLEKLDKIKIKHPVDTMLNLAEKAGLSKKAALLAAEEFDVIRPAQCTAYDVYFALWMIPQYSKLESMEAILTQEEDISRTLNLDFTFYDHKSNWL